LGRLVLDKLQRPAGPYMALFVGLVLLYLVFMIPFLVFGVLAQILAALLGLGAMTMTYLAHRQARKAAVAAA
jgi:predicted membrane protein